MTCETWRPGREDLRLAVIVAHCQPRELPASESGGVQQDYREAIGVGAQRRPEGRPERRGLCQDAHDVRFGEQVGPAPLMTRREQPSVRHEARRVRASTIQAEVSHDAHAIAAHPRRQMRVRQTPLRKRRRCQVALAPPGPQEDLEMAEHATLDVVASPQRGFECQVPLDAYGHGARGHGCAPARTSPVPCGTGNAISRRSSTASRR